MWNKKAGIQVATTAIYIHILVDFFIPLTDAVREVLFSLSIPFSSLIVHDF